MDIRCWRVLLSPLSCRRACVLQQPCWCLPILSVFSQSYKQFPFFSFLFSHLSFHNFALVRVATLLFNGDRGRLFRCKTDAAC